MRRVLVLALLALVALTGCMGLSAPGTDTSHTSPASGTVTTASGGTPAGTATDEQATGTGRDGERAAAPPDPPTDRIGWEAGYWHNESIAVDNSDGMNASERHAAVARAMARVEYVRHLEFDMNGTIPITVISRAEHRNRTLDSGRNITAAFRTFDNTKFEAMFLVGEDTDSLAAQRSNRAATTQGYYDPINDSIVLISNSGKPQFDGERTLAQEVGHALQDSHFNITALRSSVHTRDALNGQNGLVEGDGNLIDERYAERCGDEWDCIPKPKGSGGPVGSGGGGDVHVGINMMRYFPYSDGPPFIQYYYERGGWDRIDRMYENPPVSAEQVIYPEKYPDERPTNVTISDATSGDWHRLRTPNGNASGTLGQSVITTMFAYTWFDDSYRQRGVGVVSPREFMNFDDSGRVDVENDPFDYDIAYSSGWDGDTLHVYTNTSVANGTATDATAANASAGSSAANETAYVWRIEWDSTSDAREFVTGYGKLLSYWGGKRVSGRDGVWRISDEASPFTDAFAVRRSGTTVTIVNAPTVADLADVSDAVSE